jgi:hypothetical protein
MSGLIFTGAAGERLADPYPAPGLKAYDKRMGTGYTGTFYIICGVRKTKACDVLCSERFRGAFKGILHRVRTLKTQTTPIRDFDVSMFTAQVTNSSPQPYQIS